MQTHKKKIYAIEPAECKQAHAQHIRL